MITKIVPGEFWNDTRGQRIEAHGGCVISHAGVWYWYGEDHALGRGNKTGINCYRSTDLLNWEHLSLALPKEAVSERYRDAGACERPKVLYCDATGKFVMWAHLAANSHVGAEAGVAVSDTPEGPFEVLREYRPIQFDYPGIPTRNWPEEPEERLREIDEVGKGGTFRDFTLFKDFDGTAYVYYASENNATIWAARLNTEYTDIVRPAVPGETWQRVLPRLHREAPAVFRVGSRYYMLNSGCTSWDPNPVHWADAPHPLGPWNHRESVFAPPHDVNGWRTQPAYVFPFPGEDLTRDSARFIYFGDRWNGKDLVDSRYVWLPFEVKRNEPIVIELRESWSPVG